MDSSMQKFVDEALQQYTEAVEQHHAQVAKMTKDYEDMVEVAAAKMELLRDPPTLQPEP